MSMLGRLFKPKMPPLTGLWNRIAAEGRRPDFYLRHGVPDTLDGRFDMVALVTCLVLVRLENEDLHAEAAQLTERFVDDMDGSLREIGVSDQLIGKHMGNMMGALGGRLGAYRDALASDNRAAELATALERNAYRGEDADQLAPGLAEEALALYAKLESLPVTRLLEGDW